MFTIKHWTLKRLLLVFSLVLSLVPLLVLGIVSFLIFTRTLQNEVDRNYQIILKQIQAQVDNYVSRMDLISLTLASNASSQAMNVIQQVIVNSDIPFDVSLSEAHATAEQFIFYCAATFVYELVGLRVQLNYF